MNGWKVTAIIFIVITLLYTAITIWAFNEVAEEEENTNMCYYDVCEAYPDAWYEDNVCYCYNEEDEIAKTKFME